MRGPIKLAAWLLQLLGEQDRLDAKSSVGDGQIDSHSFAPAGGRVDRPTSLPPDVPFTASQPGVATINQLSAYPSSSAYETFKWHGHVARPADGGKAWREAYRQAAELVSQMTVEEKVNLTTAVWGPCPSNSGGVPRLNISGMCFDDGPSGPRYTDFVTQFPSAFTAAASFDRDLIEERALRIGREFKGKGINVALAPVTGGPLGRSPFAGRNWEAFSPDPYLSSTLSFRTVRGMQESGLITCAKHYVLYEQEPVCTGPLEYGSRTKCHDVDSVVDDKTLKELYLPSFVESVRAGTGAVMCSYNLINGTQSCENDQSMNRILKDELGFQGFDYGATHSTVPSVLAGMDMELPGEYWYGKRLLKAVHKKQIPISRLDDMARRILTPQIAARQTEHYPRTNFYHRDLADERHEGNRVLRNEHVDVRGDNPAFARKVAAESTVLLKNTGVLPLRNIRRIGIFGSDADYPSTLSGCGPDLFCMIASERRYWNGTVTIGGGSGAAYADYIVPPLEGIAKIAREKRIRLDWVLHDDAAHHDQMYFVARQSEVCLVFVSVFLVENWDRDGGDKALRLDREGEDMIKRVESACAGQVVVVMHIGGQVIVEEWVDLPNIGAVLFAGYPGQESGSAIADILFGSINPSGKLPFTMGKRVSDWPTDNIIREMPSKGNATVGVEHLDEVTQISRPPAPRAVFYEGLAIDYKWFDKRNIEPRWEFGFGMSYTSFVMSDLTFKLVNIKDEMAIQETNERYEGRAELYDVLYEVSVNITNTGSIPGAEVAQLYLTYPEFEVDQPPKHLRGFGKAYLEPGQSGVVTMRLRKKDLAVWDVVKQVWRVPEGNHVIRVGSSSRRLPLESTLSLDSSI